MGERGLEFLPLKFWYYYSYSYTHCDTNMLLSTDIHDFIDLLYTQRIYKYTYTYRTLLYLAKTNLGVTINHA